MQHDQGERGPVDHLDAHPDLEFGGCDAVADEKAMLPGGDESFSPTINPAPPGAVCKEIVNGVCMR